MKFRTEINIPESSVKISHEDRILTIGSCFAENIAARLEHSGFNVINNPFGVLYNPVSIVNSLEIVSQSKVFDEKDLITDQNEFHSFYHHSSFSSHDKNFILSHINKTTEKLSTSLPATDFAFISLGTAYVYKNLKMGKVVSNCHKIPQKEFHRFRMGQEEVIDELEKIINLLRSFNPGMNILFTVSPVRHLKDGAHENNLSKALLLLGIEKTVSANQGCFYFPSYELLLDDLRDYRFYAGDLLHPSEEAVEYIKEKFYQSYFSKETIDLAARIERIKTAKNHRVRNPESQQHKKFVESNIIQIKSLLKEYPFLPLQDDLEHFSKIFDNYFTNTK